MVGTLANTVVHTRTAMKQQAPLLTNDSGGAGLLGFVGRERVAAAEAVGMLVASTPRSASSTLGSKVSHV